MDLGLLIVRVVFGLTLAARGAQKSLGWFGGSGISGAIASLERLGLCPGRPFVIVAALAECASGMLFAVGLLVPAVATPIIAGTVLAILTVHRGRGLLGHDGLELPLLHLAIALSMVLTGPGAYSLDSLLGLTALSTSEFAALFIVVGVMSGFLSLVFFDLPPLPKDWHA